MLGFRFFSICAFRPGFAVKPSFLGRYLSTFLTHRPACLLAPLTFSGTTKEESEELEAAVCLKKCPQGYVLGISDKIEDLKLLFTPSREEVEKCYQYYIACMREFGTPFGGRP